MKNVTIRDVADRAGVSHQTVSRVINNQPHVAEETRQNVLAIVEELGYIPNASARSLALNKTHILGLIVPDFNEPVYTDALIGAEMEAKRRGYFFMLGITKSDETKESEYFRLLTEQRVEGILFMYPGQEVEYDHYYLDFLINQQLPLVSIAYQSRQKCLTVVNIDNQYGGHLATRHLINKGHRHIGLITGLSLWQPARRRTEGYRQALEEAGIAFDSALIEGGDWKFNGGECAAQKLLERSPHVTAIFAQNDYMAIGAIRAIRACGRRVPEDVAVLGYDDVPVAAYYDPPLSTISQPMQEVGQTAAQLLIDLIGDPHAEPREILLKPTLVLRESTGD